MLIVPSAVGTLAVSLLHFDPYAATAPGVSLFHTVSTAEEVGHC